MNPDEFTVHQITLLCSRGPVLYPQPDQISSSLSKPHKCCLKITGAIYNCCLCSRGGSSQYFTDVCWPAARFDCSSAAAVSSFDRKPRGSSETPARLRAPPHTLRTTVDLPSNPPVSISTFIKMSQGFSHQLALTALFRFYGKTTPGLLW